MKIKYEFVNGDVSEVDVELPKEIADFYCQSIEQERSSNRRNSRTDRHMSLESLDYEDSKYFTASDGLPEIALSDLEVEHMLSCLNDNQRSLVQKCVLGGMPYSEMARQQNKDESAIRHAVKRALKKIKKNFI